MRYIIRAWHPPAELSSSRKITHIVPCPFRFEHSHHLTRAFQPWPAEHDGDASFFSIALVPIRSCLARGVPTEAGISIPQPSFSSLCFVFNLHSILNTAHSTVSSRACHNCVWLRYGLALPAPCHSFLQLAASLGVPLSISCSALLQCHNHRRSLSTPTLDDPLDPTTSHWLHGDTPCEAPVFWVC